MEALRSETRKSAGKIATFYSYKGGTGRSMLLANVAWLLANRGKRVLVIDWDLEAPGLHRYFEPFLADKDLATSTGIIDFVLEYATAAVSAGGTAQTKDWFVQHTNLLRHAISVDWRFSGDGLIDLVPAGRQDTAYASRVNSFDWHHFYEKLGGGVLLEAVKLRLRELYDYILIDSRTGVSDTSGVCTVQMPDELVVCFTLNRQSIYGASAVALSAFNQRKGADGVGTLKLWPVPTRIDYSEKDRLDMARVLARTRFSAVLRHLDGDEEDKYWGEMEVPYNGYYAYEEVLATFGDRPRQTGTLLSKVELIAGALAGESTFAPMEESQRLSGLSRFTARSAWNYEEELKLLGQEYETLRKGMDPGSTRTYLMTALMGRAQTLGGRSDAGRVGEQIFNLDTDGARVVGLALVRNEPQRGHVEMSLQGISESRSAFEQFHALLLAKALLPALDPTAVQRLGSAIQAQLNKTITGDDASRWNLAHELLAYAQSQSKLKVWSRSPEILAMSVQGVSFACVECHPTTSFVRYEDVDERHGPFVGTRKAHALQLPPVFRLSRYLVTNEMFLQFIKAGGYSRDEYWTISPEVRARLLTADRTTGGPAAWPSALTIPERNEQHPVSGICYSEADAFVAWLNTCVSKEEGWCWSLPTEDAWEFAARTDSGLTYPWGDAFDGTKCNSLEAGLGSTTEVSRFPAGASRLGCFDMAGNVWEYVKATDADKDRCVLRGGSYKNNRFQIRSYLRLVRVSLTTRAPDFGFRVGLFQTAAA